MEYKLAKHFFLLLAFLCSPVWAANHYIRDGGTASTSGTGSCTGWDTASACDTLPATLVRGDTYYIADGTYAAYTFSTANSGTTVITVKKATAADHGTDTNWVSTYGDGQADFTGGWQIYTDYYVFNGQSRNSNWRTGAVDQYGFKVANTRIDNGAGTGGDNLTFNYIDFHGGGRDTGDGDDVIYDLVGGTNITFQYCALRDSDRTIFLTRGTPTNWLIEYSYIARNASSAAIHGEIHSSTSSSNFTWRYNVIEDPEGTAVWAFINDGTADNWYIYGNVIFHSSSYNREGISGVMYVANDASNDNTLNGLRFYNNTIWNIQGLWSGVVIQQGTDDLVYNNIWSQSATPNNSGGTYNYNTYYATTTQFDSNAQTVGTQPLTSPSTGDFTLVAATTAGTTLASPYNTDPTGATRGADGVFDRGAFEYQAGGAGPSVPSNFRLVDPFFHHFAQEH